MLAVPTDRSHIANLARGQLRLALHERGIVILDLVCNTGAEADVVQLDGGEAIARQHGRSIIEVIETIIRGIEITVVMSDHGIAIIEQPLLERHVQDKVLVVVHPFTHLLLDGLLVQCGVPHPEFIQLSGEEIRKSVGRCICCAEVGAGIGTGHRVHLQCSCIIDEVDHRGVAVYLGDNPVDDTPTQ